MTALPPFAAAMSRVNVAVMATLSNALASIGGGEQLPVLFDADYVVADVGIAGMAAAAPAITLPTASVPMPATGQTVTLTTGDGVSIWRSAEHHPDGAGLSVLLLERTA